MMSVSESYGYFDLSNDDSFKYHCLNSSKPSDGFEYHSAISDARPDTRPNQCLVSHNSTDLHHSGQCGIKSPEELYSSSTNVPISAKMHVISQDSFFLTNGLEDIFIDDHSSALSLDTRNETDSSCQKPQCKFNSTRVLPYYSPSTTVSGPSFPNSLIMTCHGSESAIRTELSILREVRMVSPDIPRHVISPTVNPIDIVLPATQVNDLYATPIKHFNSFRTPLRCKYDASYNSHEERCHQ